MKWKTKYCAIFTPYFCFRFALQQTYVNLERILALTFLNSDKRGEVLVPSLFNFNFIFVLVRVKCKCIKNITVHKFNIVS